MGRRRTTPELQKLKTLDDSPELTHAKATSSQKINTYKCKRLSKSKDSPQIVTRARKRHALTNVGLIHKPEMNDTPMAIEDRLQKDANALPPNMFYSKRCQRLAKSAKLPENNEQNHISAVKKRNPATENKKSKQDSNKFLEPNSDKNDFLVILQNKSYIKAKQKNCTNKKNIENKISASRAPPEPLTLKKQIREVRRKNKAHMTTEEVITKLTTEKVDVTEKINVRVNNDADDDISVKRCKTAKLANHTGIKKRKVHLSLADIVNEISHESPEKKLLKSEIIPDSIKSAVSLQKGGSTTKQNAMKKNHPPKVSNNANKLNDEWDHSLLLITDDFNDSGNVYDFEEFQICAKSSLPNNSSFRKFDKKSAAMKAVFNKKANKDRVLRRKKNSNGKTSKIAATKKIVPKKVSPITGGTPTPGSQISVENQQNSVNNCGISVSEYQLQTPSIQIIKEPVSITELEKVKVTKHIENKVVSKVNPGVCYPPQLASDWPQLPDLPSQQFTKLKRGAMEGPTDVDTLPENKPKPIKTSGSFNQSSLDISSINAESPANINLPAKVYSKKLDAKLPDKISSVNNQPIDLFTYPVALPTKKQVDGMKKHGKCKKSKQTPDRKLMDFMYVGSVERYLKKPKDDANLTSPPPIMLPKFLHAETSTPNTEGNCPHRPLGGESMCISPVKDFQSPASMRTYEHISRRNSSSFLSITKNVDIFNDEPKENLPQGKKTAKTKAKKKDGYFKTNKNFDEWANRMSNEFDEIENFELSIEN